MNPNKPWQISPATPLQKTYAPDSPDVVMVPVVIINDRIAKGEDGNERVVMVKRGALPRAALAALTGGRGYKQIRQNDFSLIDSGRCRLALWEALGMEAAPEPTVIRKSEPVKQNTQDRMIEAARSLDRLVEDIAKGRE